MSEEEKPPEKTPVQTELEASFDAISKQSIDQIVQAIQQKCLDEGRKCADEANSKMVEGVPEAELSKTLTEATLKCTCHVPDCYKDALMNFNSFKEAQEDLAFVSADGISEMCKGFMVDVTATNAM